MRIESWSGIGLRAWVGGLIGLHLLQELFDAFDVFLRKIEGEVEIGQTPELKALDEFMANKAGSVLESLDGVGLFLGVFGADAHEDAGVLHVRLYADFADADIAFEARVLEFADKHGVDFVGDFLAHAFVTMRIGTHMEVISFQ